MDLDLLDENEKPKEDGQILQSVRWWEIRRPIFTGLIIATQLAVMIYRSRETIHFGIPIAVIGSFIYLVAANLFYCLGWGIDILIRFYFKNNGLDWQWRIALLVLGTLFTMFVTFGIYEDVL